MGQGGRAPLPSSRDKQAATGRSLPDPQDSRRSLCPPPPALRPNHPSPASQGASSRILPRNSGQKRARDTCTNTPPRSLQPQRTCWNKGSGPGRLLWETAQREVPTGRAPAPRRAPGTACARFLHSSGGGTQSKQGRSLSPSYVPGTVPGQSAHQTVGAALAQLHRRQQREAAPSKPLEGSGGPRPSTRHPGSPCQSPPPLPCCSLPLLCASVTTAALTPDRQLRVFSGRQLEAGQVWRTEPPHQAGSALLPPSLSECRRGLHSLLGSASLPAGTGMTSGQQGDTERWELLEKPADAVTSGTSIIYKTDSSPLSVWGL